MQIPSVYGAGATIIGGTPTQVGTFKFTMKVTDGSGQSASQQFKLTINDGGGRQ